MEEIYKKTILLLGKENTEKLKKSNICIVGIGGVGSYTLEALSRCGILNITIIDKDVVDISNINRQLIALNSTVGKSKVEVAFRRVLDINPDIKINAMKLEITKQNVNQILNQNFDYIVDCVDNLEAKIAIIEYAYKNNVKCISSMGMGKRINPLDIKVSDISKSSVCPLAKKVRKVLKNLGIKKQKVVFSVENPIKSNDNTEIGSISFVPSTAGLVIASEVVKDILGVEVKE